MRRPTPAQRIEYGLFAAVAAGVRSLPEAWAFATGSGLARLGWWPFGIRRRVVEANLRTAFPDRTDAWVRAIAAASYTHLGREIVALVRAAGRDPAAVRANTEFTNEVLLRDVVAQGNGAVVLTAHLGNWELGAAALARPGVTVDIVVQRQRNPLFDRALIAWRRSLGVNVIDRGRATREGVRSLRANHVLVLAPDQNAGRSGMFLPFFGKAASTARGPAILAARAAAPILMTTAPRTPEGRLRVCLALLADRLPRSDAAVADVMTRYLSALEDAVREWPAQYLWQHRRWKTRPPAPGA